VATTEHRVYDVFTPTTQAQINFVPREAVNDQLVDALYTPGKQLIVYGESGSGKSTLLLNKLHHTYSSHVTTQCSAAMTYDKLLLDAFDQLDQYYIEGRRSQRSRSVSPALEADFSRIRASVDATLSTTSDRSESRVLPPQLTAQRLAQFLGAQGMCWVVEDFHKMPPEEKLPFAQSLKIFSDVSATYPDVKVVTIGATETARQVVEYDSEMTNRVSELLVPLMTNQELTEIILNGQQLLNLDLSDLADPIAQYSVGVPSVCHQLALNACLEKQVVVSQISRRALTRDDLKPAVKRYISESSDTLKARFDKALRRHKVKKFDNCRLILEAIASGSLSGMLFADILAVIRETKDDYPTGNLTTYLRELTQDKRGNILRSGIDGRYRFIDPLYHTFAQLTLLKPSYPKTSTSVVGTIVANELLNVMYVGSGSVLSTYTAYPAYGDSTNFATITELPQQPRLIASPERRVRDQASPPTQ
jgi:energy-coupling factor transporter ATP-binding protein EcfA2